MSVSSSRTPSDNNLGRFSSGKKPSFYKLSNNSSPSKPNGFSANISRSPSTYMEEGYAGIGAPGCLSWECEITKGRLKDRKLIYFEPSTGTIFQQGESSQQKSFLASHIQEILFITDESINVIIKSPAELVAKTRVYTFGSGVIASEFKAVVEHNNEFGEFIKLAFKAIVKSDLNGVVNYPMLQAALTMQDVNIEPEDTRKMINYFGDEHSGTVDYLHFFLIFPNSFVRTLRECLLEWLRRVRVFDMDGVNLAMSRSSFDSGKGIDSYRNGLHLPPLIPGEKQVCHSLTNIRWSVCAPKTVGTILYDQYNKHLNDTYLGNIHFTNYRIIITSSAARDAQLYGKPHSRYFVPDYFSQVSIPLNDIQKLQVVLPGALTSNSTTRVSNTGGHEATAVTNHNPIGTPTFLYILCKDIRVIKLLLYPGRLSAEALIVSELSTPTGSVRSEQDGSGGFQPLSQQLMPSCSNVNELVTMITKHAFPFSTSANAANAKAYLNAGPTGHGPYSDSSNNVFAFKYKMQFQENGWDLSDVLKDYVRQGLLGMKEYRIFDNSEYKFCPTYPSHLVIPASASTIILNAVANYRSSQRIPVVTYLHRNTKSVLTRSSQPLSGVLKRRCDEDVELLNYYRLKGQIKGKVSSSLKQSNSTKEEVGHDPKFFVFDVRSQLSATANVAKGGGFEEVSWYHNTEVLFGNVENIHYVRNSWNLLGDLVLPGAGEEDIAYLYHTKLDETHWLKHLRVLLNVSSQVSEKLHLENSSVLVHCSDGWDRTAQVCSLVQIMIDPYYRTLEGIAVLIEKEWCAFGYKFQDRCGHGLNNNTLADEKSPVFIQFLDCLMQIMMQFPNSFEFNTFLILFIADHVYSGLFGNFLGNSDKERRNMLKVMDKTQSIWSYVYEYSERYINQHFEPYFDCIWPNSSVKHIALWERYYSRWDPKLHPNSLNIWDQWHDDWGNGYETVPESKSNVENESAL